MKHINAISIALPRRAASLLAKQHQLENAAMAVGIAQEVVDLLGLSKAGDDVHDFADH